MDIAALAQLCFTLIMLAIIGGLGIWGSFKLTRSVSASRRETAMKAAGFVAAARANASKRSAARLA